MHVLRGFDARYESAVTHEEIREWTEATRSAIVDQLASIALLAMRWTFCAETIDCQDREQTMRWIFLCVNDCRNPVCTGYVFQIGVPVSDAESTSCESENVSVFNQ